MVPVGMRLLIWAGANPFHTGDCAMTEQLCFPAPFQAALEGFQHSLLEGVALLLRDHPLLLQHRGTTRVPTGSWAIFKAYMVIRKKERKKEVGGVAERKKALHSTKATEFPKEAVISTTKLLFHGLSPSSAPPTPQLVFPSLSQQMTCRCTSHLAGSPPPLSKKGEKRKEKEGK